MDDEYPDTRDIPEDECCICGSYDVKILDPFGYPFCEQHEHRAWFIARGRQNDWPALRIVGKTGTYAIPDGVEDWLIDAFAATDERIVELLDALDEYEERLRLAS